MLAPLVFANPKSPWPCTHPLGASVPVGLVHKRISNLNSLHTLQLEASSNICLPFQILSAGLKATRSFKPPSYLCKPNQVCVPHVADGTRTPPPSPTTPFYTICAPCSLGPLHIWLQAGVMPFLLIWSHLVICSVFLRSDWKLFLFWLFLILYLCVFDVQIHVKVASISQ